MSNLLKSKFILGFVAVAIMLVGVSFASAADCSLGTSTLKYGQKSAAVTCLQTYLNVSPATGYFGKLTLAAVKAFQTNNSLTADGLVGKGTKATLVTGGTPTNPPTTSDLCPNGMTLASNCTVLPGGTTPVITTGPVSVALSTDNPAAGTVISGQAGADLAHFTFTGTGTLNSVTLTRGGISTQSTLSNLYLYDGATRLTDGYTFNNTGILTINNLNLAVNGTKTIAVKADVAIADYSVSVSLASFTAGTSVNPVNLKGNEMYIASGSGLLGTASLTVASPSPANATINAGSMNQSLWTNTLSIGAHASKLNGMTVKMIGSAPSNTLANVALYVDGVNVASSTINSNNQFVFALATPLNLSTGSHAVEVRGDVVGGAYRNFYLALEKSSDIVVMDGQVQGGGVIAIAATYNSQPVSNMLGGLMTINNGTLTINQDTSFNNTTTLVGGATNVKMAAFKLTAYGEDVKVNSLTFTPTIPATGTTATGTASTALTPVVTLTNAGGANYLQAPAVTFTLTCTAGTTTQPTGTAVISGGKVTGVTGITAGVCTGVGTPTGVTVAFASVNATSPTATTPFMGTFANVGLYINGGQVGSSVTATNSTDLVFSSLGSNLVVTAGQSMVVEIRGDVMTSASTPYQAGSVKFDLKAGSSNAQGVTSGQLTSTGASGGQSLTISSTNVTFAQTSGWAASQISPNQAGKKVGTFTISTGSAEGITVNNILVGITGTMITNNQITNITLKDGSSVIGTPIGNPTASNNFSVSLPVGISSNKTIDVYADIGSSAATYTVIPAMTVTYRGGTSQTTTTSAAVTGSTITANVASLVAGGVTFVPGSSMVAQFLIGGQSSVQIGTFNIKANTLVAGAVIKDVTVTVPANTIGSVTLNGVTGQVNGTTATLYNVGLTVPADASGINAPMTVSLVCVTAAGGGCAGVSNSTTSASITTVTYFDGSATQTISPSAVTPDHKLVASKPTVSMVDTNVSGLATTRVKLGEFSISADVAGDIKIEALPITLSASTGTSAITFTGVSLYNAAGDTVIVGSGGTNGTTVLTASGTFTFSTPRVITKNTTETYSVWGTVVDAAGLGASGTSSVSFGLGDKGTFAWTDVIGGVSAIPGTQLNTYPTTTYTKHN